MEQYTMHCSEEQTKKASELGAPIEPQTSSTLIDTPCAFCDDGMYIIPTAEQMIGWLEDYGFNFSICRCPDGTFCNFFQKGVMKYYYTRKEATLAAIDAALDCLIENKK